MSTLSNVRVPRVSLNLKPRRGDRWALSALKHPIKPDSVAFFTTCPYRAARLSNSFHILRLVSFVLIILRLLNGIAKVVNVCTDSGWVLGPCLCAFLSMCTDHATHSSANGELVSQRKHREFTG
jgi:hypothetical protein